MPTSTFDEFITLGDILDYSREQDIVEALEQAVEKGISVISLAQATVIDGAIIRALVDFRFAFINKHGDRSVRLLVSHHGPVHDVLEEAGFSVIFTISYLRSNPAVARRLLDSQRPSSNLHQQRSVPT